MTYEEKRIITLKAEIEFLKKKSPPGKNIFNRCIARREREIEKLMKGR